MPFLTVGGVVIPVAPSGGQRDRLDAVDRRRAFDNTYRASATGNAKREWHFSTPPILRQVADLYEGILATVTAQTCSGDVLGGSSNLFTKSEQLDDAAWTKTRIFASADTAVAPDGTSSADRLTEDGTATTDHYISRNFPALTDNTLYTLSAFGKANSRSWFRFRGINKAGVATFTYINFATGLAGSGSGQTAVVTPYGNGWYRAQLTFDAQSGGTTPSTEIGLASGDGGAVYSGDGASNAFLWGLQFEPGASATSYVKTTTGSVSTLNPSCCSEITGWTPVKNPGGHLVVLDFALHEV